MHSFRVGIQNSVSRFMIPQLPPRRTEAEASSENGPSNMLVGGAGFRWSVSMRIIIFSSKETYQGFNSLSSLPSENITS